MVCMGCILQKHYYTCYRITIFCIHTYLDQPVRILLEVNQGQDDLESNIALVAVQDGVQASLEGDKTKTSCHAGFIFEDGQQVLHESF